MSFDRLTKLQIVLVTHVAGVLQKHLWMSQIWKTLSFLFSFLLNNIFSPFSQHWILDVIFKYVHSFSVIALSNFNEGYTFQWFQKSKL